MPSLYELQDLFRHARSSSVLYVPTNCQPCLACANIRDRRRIAALSRDWTPEPPIHPPWSACRRQRRRKVNHSRSTFPRSPGVHLSAGRLVPIIESGSPASASGAVVVAPPSFIPALSLHVHATSPGVRRSDIASSSRVDVGHWPWPGPCAAAAAATAAHFSRRAFPAPSGRWDRPRADGARALGPHGRALSKHP
jgi:hypothetical protein